MSLLLNGYKENIDFHLKMWDFVYALYVMDENNWFTGDLWGMSPTWDTILAFSFQIQSIYYYPKFNYLIKIFFKKKKTTTSDKN